MKKKKYLIILLLSIFAFNINVFAASGSLGVSSSSVYVGDSFTVTANVNSAAAWNIHVSASGPVSGCTINQADATADAMDTNKTFSATCTATGTGTITIRLSGDVTSAADGNAVNVSGSKSVTVSTKPAPTPTPTPTPTPSTPSAPSTPVISPETGKDNRSTNNNLKSLTVENYSLKTTDNRNYTLTVKNSIESINIIAVAEDSKATITGAGKQSLKVGENKFDIIVKAENTSTKTYTLTVTRKDDIYTLEELDDAIEEAEGDITIHLKEDDVLTTDILNKIKKSSKKVHLTKYSNENKLEYSWIIDGSKLSNLKETKTNITYAFLNQEKFDQLSGYRNGIYFRTSQEEIVTPSTLQIYVGNKYKDKDKVNLYYYNEKTKEIELIEKNLVVENETIQASIKKGSHYFITKAEIKDEAVITSKDNNIYKPIAIAEFGIILIVGLGIVFGKRKKNKKEKVETPTPTQDIL